MLGILALLLLAALVCARLGAWQLDRARERGEQAAERAAAQEAQAPPVPLADLLSPQTALTQDALGRRVVVTGTYVPGTELVVPGQERAGRAGSVLLAALRVDDAEGAVLPVARGWVALGTADAVRAASAGGPLAPPAGPVTLVGSLAGAEAAADARPGVVGSVSPAQLVNLWGGPIYDASLRLDTAEPAEAADVLPLPVASLGGGGGLELQNLAYAAQWWIFGGFAIFLWVRLVRDEAE
jgi:cytochrome oxidase assembly protein ShyY1